MIDDTRPFEATSPYQKSPLLHVSPIEGSSNTAHYVIRVLPSGERFLGMSQQPQQHTDINRAGQDSSSEEVLMEERRSTPPLKVFKATKRPHSPEPQPPPPRSVHFQPRISATTCPSSTSPSMASPTLVARPAGAERGPAVVQFVADGSSKLAAVEHAPTSAHYPAAPFIMHAPGSALVPQTVFMSAHGDALPPGAFFAAPVAYGQGHPRMMSVSRSSHLPHSAPVYTAHEAQSAFAYSSTPPVAMPWSDGRQASLSSSTDQLTTASSIASTPGVVTSRSPHPGPAPAHQREAFTSQHRGMRYPSTGSLSSTTTSGAVPRAQAPVEMRTEPYPTMHPAAPTAAVAAAAAAAAGYSIPPEYAIQAIPAGHTMESVYAAVPYQNHLMREMRTNAAIRLPALPRPEEGHCQAGGELRLSQLKHCSQKIHVPAGCALVGCRSPQLGQTTLLATVDKRYLPDPHTGSNVQGFHGNCVGCGKTGFHFFTDFCTHINLRLNTQPKKQKHIRYYIDADDNGCLKTGAVVPWKGSSTLLLFTSGANKGAVGSESDDATSPDQLGSINSGSSAGKEAMKYRRPAEHQAARRSVRSASCDGAAFAPASIRLNSPPSLEVTGQWSGSRARASLPSQGQTSHNHPSVVEIRSSATGRKAVLLPCFGHSAAAVEEIAATIQSELAARGLSTASSQPGHCVRDILEQPLSTVHQLCLQHRCAEVLYSPPAGAERRKAAALISSACHLLAGFLVACTHSKIILREAFALFMHRGLVADERRHDESRQAVDTASVVSTLTSLAATSHGVLAVSVSTSSLCDAVQTCITRAVDVDSPQQQQQPPIPRRAPDFTLCVHYKSESVLDMEVCVLVQSQLLLAQLQDADDEAAAVSDEGAIQAMYEMFVDMQRSAGLASQSDLPPLRELPIRTYGLPSDPTGPLNLPSPSRDTLCLSPAQQHVARDLADRCYDQMASRLASVPGKRFDVVDFIVLVRQSCPVYVEMVQRLVGSKAVEQLLLSRGVSPVHVPKVARERVICVDSDDALLATQLSKLRAYARSCPQTLFLVVAKDCMKSPRASSDAHTELQELLELPNTTVICSMMSHYSWLAAESLLPPGNTVHVQPDVDSYRGIKHLLSAYSWTSSSATDGQQKWTVDESFESALNMLKSASACTQLMSESDLRAFLVLQEYVLAWDYLRSGRHQAHGVSRVTDDIITDLMQSKVPATSIIRVPNRSLAVFFWNQLCSLFHSQEQEARSSPTDDIILALYDGQGPIRVCQKVRGSSSFLSPESPRPPSTSSAGGQSISQVSSFHNLPSGRVLLIMGGAVANLRVPSNVRFVDYRPQGQSYLTRADFQEELSLMHGYSMTESSDSAPSKASSTTAAFDNLPCMAIISAAMLKPVRAIAGSALLTETGHLMFGIQNLLPCECVEWVDGIHRHPLTERHTSDDPARDETAYYRRWCSLRGSSDSSGSVPETPSAASPKLWLLTGPAKSGKTDVLLEMLRLVIHRWLVDNQRTAMVAATMDDSIEEK